MTDADVGQAHLAVHDHTEYQTSALQLRTSLNVADVAENIWHLMLKIRFWSKIYINAKVMVLKHSKFPDKGWNVNDVNYLLKKLRDNRKWTTSECVYS